MIIIQSLLFRKLILTALPHFITMTLILVRRADKSLLKLSLRLEQQSLISYLAI